MGTPLPLGKLRPALLTDLFARHALGYEDAWLARARGMLGQLSVDRGIDMPIPPATVSR